MKLLENKTAVVTGSSSGIGRAIAIALAEAGAAVLIHGRSNRSGADQSSELVKQHGSASEVILADLSSSGAQDEFAAAAWSWRGSIDIWINNAGVDVLTGEAASYSFERKIDLLWRIDCLASIRLTREIGRRMKARAETDANAEPGRFAITNIGWDQAATGMEGDSGEMFAATKGAVMAFTRSAAKSLAPAVRVNCVAPGWIKTAWGDQAPDHWDERAIGESALGRWGQPADVAAAACYLASPAASFVTGQVLNVNGGFRSSRHD